MTGRRLVAALERAAPAAGDDESRLALLEARMLVGWLHDLDAALRASAEAWRIEQRRPETRLMAIRRLAPDRPRLDTRAAVHCAVCLLDVLAVDVEGEGGAAIPVGPERAVARRSRRTLRRLTLRCPACGGLTGGDHLDGEAYPDLRLLPIEGR